MDDGWHGEDHMLFDALERWKRTTRKRCTLPRGFASRESLWDHSLLGTTADIYIYIFIYLYIYIYTYIYIHIYIHVNQCPPAPVFIVFSLYPAGHFLSQLLGQNWGTFSHNIWDSSKLKVHNWWTKCCVSKYREPTIFGEIHIRHW